MQNKRLVLHDSFGGALLPVQEPPYLVQPCKAPLVLDFPFCGATSNFPSIGFPLQGFFTHLLLLFFTYPS